MLKKIAMGTALATLIAVPAFAAQGNGRNIRTIDSVTADYTNVQPRAATAFAYAPGAFSGPDRVYVDGKYAGQDPDPNVRLQLRPRNPLSY
ncbi:MAG: hypothetical protein P8Z80_12955 [Pseudolabrys sp.]